MSLIDRDALIDYIESEKSGLCSAREFQSDYIECINDMPVIDATPVIHGVWKDVDGMREYHCSICGAEAPNDGYDCGANYCYNCGARMDGE